MEKYRVKIISPNAKVIFRGKVLRTPVTCKGVYDSELTLLKGQIRRHSLKAEIVNEAEVKEEEIKPLIVEKHDKDIKIEELYDPENEPNSIMDRLIAEEKVKDE